SGRSFRGLAAGELAALVEPAEALHRGAHQEAVAFLQKAFSVVGIDVRMPDRHLVLLAGLDHAGHPFQHFGMFVLTWITELLREIAFADQDAADARNLGQDLVQIFDALGVLHLQDDEDFTLGVERPHIRALIIFLLGKPPIAQRLGWTVAAQSRRMVMRRALETWVATGRHRAIGLVDARYVRPYDPIGADVEHLLGVPLRLLASVWRYAHHRGD